MDTTFLNSENSKISDPHLKRKDQYVAISNLSIYYTWKNIKKSHAKIVNLKYQLRYEMKIFELPD